MLICDNSNKEDTGLEPCACCIGYACKLLTETNKTVATICYDSGFNNFSNFNRHFKSITHKTPLEYRKRDELDAP
ncbi:MAG: helix-turn-helix domain-containing protein [Ferruginibacter sp.]